MLELKHLRICSLYNTLIHRKCQNGEVMLLIALCNISFLSSCWPNSSYQTSSQQFFNSRKILVWKKNIQYVFCVGILIAQKRQKADIVFHVFSIFQLIYFPKLLTVFFLRGLNLKFSIFVWVLDFKMFDVVPRMWILVVKKRQKCF